MFGLQFKQKSVTSSNISHICMLVGCDLNDINISRYHKCESIYLEATNMGAQATLVADIPLKFTINNGEPEC